MMFEIERDDIDGPMLVEKLKEKGISVLAKGPKLMSMVLHRDISDEDLEFVVNCLQELIPFSKSIFTIKGENFQAAEAFIPMESEAAKQQTGLSVTAENETLLSSSEFPTVASAATPENSSIISVDEIISMESNNHTIATKFTEEDPVVPSSSVCSITVPYESSFVCGMSVSDQGFCVFL
jgi:hypothetical protein